MRRVGWSRLSLILVLTALAALPPAAAASPALADSAAAWSVAALPPNPDARSFHDLVYAPELGYLIVFGGYTDRGPDSDVFWLDLAHRAAGWHTFAPSGPRPSERFQAAATWDPAGHRLIVFGGIRGLQQTGDLYFGAAFLDDTWALTFDPLGTQPPHWSLLDDGTGAPLLAPSKRAGASAVYDAAGGRMVVYGGNDTFAGYLGEGGEFVERFTGLPTQRQGLDDVWAYDLAGGGGWTKLAGSPLSPGPRLLLHQAVIDPVNRQMVVTGGAMGTNGGFDYTYNHATYGFDLTTGAWSTWSPANAALSPGIVDGASGYSPELGALVVYAGQVDYQLDVDTSRVYALKLGPGGQGSAWSVLPSTGAPKRALVGARGAVVPGGDVLEVTGGIGSGGSDGFRSDPDLAGFALGAGRWSTSMGAADVMEGNADAAAAVDPRSRTAYVVGGFRGRRQTWALDLVRGTWSQLRTSGEVPDGGAGMTAVWAHHRIYLTGTGDGSVFTLDPAARPPTWERLAVAGEAPTVVGARAVYDPVRDRILLFGGHFLDTPFPSYFGAWQQPDENEQVFALDLAGTRPAWRVLRPSGPAPVAIDGGVAAYDPFADRVVLFGGARDTATLPATSNDTVALDLTAGRDGAWHPLDPTGLPPLGNPPAARSGAVGVFDTANDRLVVWGGLTNDPNTYALDLAGEAPAWEQLATTGDPNPAVGAVGVYDAAGRRLVTFSGYTAAFDEDLAGSRDTMALSLGGTLNPPARPTAPERARPRRFGPVAGGHWSAIGPPGARTISVAISPAFAADHTAFAGTVQIGDRTDARGAGLFVTRDGGATWSAAGGDVASASILRVAPAPTDPARAYATAVGRPGRGNVFATRDHGASWTDVGRGLPQAAYYGLAVDPANADHLWVSGDTGGIFASTDGGASWRHADAGLDGRSAFALGALQVGGAVRLLAATRGVGEKEIGEGQVYRSDDGGATWNLVLADPYLTLAFGVDPADARRVLLAAGDGVWRSEDGGDTWQHVNQADPLHANAVAFDATSGGTVAYAGGVFYDVDFQGAAGGDIAPLTPGLWRSTDGGATWARVDGVPAEEDVGAVAVSANGTNVLAASLDSGVYASGDGGATFAASSDGFHQSLAQAVAPDAADPDHLVTAAQYGGVNVTDDGGATWRSVQLAGSSPGDEVAARFLLASPSRPGRVLAIASNGIQRSEDGGETWTVVPTGPQDYPGGAYKQPSGLAFDPHDADTWYAAMENGVLLVTHDDGATFERPAVAGGTDCLLPIAVDPADADHVVVGEVCSGGVHVTRDGGATWTRSAQGMDDGVTTLAFDPVHAGVVWAGTVHEGVFRSSDGGVTWSRPGVGIGYRYVKDIVADPSVPDRLFAAVDGVGVFESDDGAASWTLVPVGGTRAPLDLSFDAAGRLLAGSESEGPLVLTAHP